MLYIPAVINSPNNTIPELATTLALSEFAGLHIVNVYNYPAAGFVGMWSGQPEKTGSALQQGESLQQNAAMHSLTE